MIVYLLSRLVILIFGTLYPAYSSFKTVRGKDVRGYVQWMKYWIVYAFLISLEPFCDFFFSPWVPFYYETKILIVAWLLCPATRGYNYLYRTMIYPALREHEENLDEFLDNFKNKWQGAFLEIGRRGSALMLGTVARVIESRLFELLQWAMFVRTAHNFASYPEAVPIPPSADMLSFPGGTENRAIQYHPALARAMVETRHRRQSDPTHFSDHLRDAVSQNRRCVRLRRSGAITSIESVRFLSEDLPFSSSNIDLTSSTETLQSYRNSGAYGSLEDLDDRVENLPPALNERLNLLAQKLSLEGLTTRDINTVVATLLSGVEPHSPVSSKGTEVRKDNLEGDPPVSSKETETTKDDSSTDTIFLSDEPDVFSDSEGDPSTEHQCDPSQHDDCLSKTGAEEEKTVAFTDPKLKLRAGRYRKRPAPNPPNSKEQSGLF